MRRVDVQKPFLSTRTSHSNSEISRKRRMVYLPVSPWVLMWTRPRTYRSRFKHGGPNAEYRYEENADSIVIVLIHGPQDETRHLKDIEGVKSLGLVRLCTTQFLVDHEPRQSTAEGCSSGECQCCFGRIVVPYCHARRHPSLLA
jgi:hypothetical protein